jgi:LacI family transcriptional regulator
MRVAVAFMSAFSGFHDPMIRGIKKSEEELRDFNIHVDYFIYNTHGNEAEGVEYIEKTVRHMADEDYNGLLIGGAGGVNVDVLDGKNISIATIVNDLPRDKRKFCVQYDGITGGRLAGDLLYWRLGENAKVALASGFQDVAINVQTAQGFLEQVKNTLNVAAILYNEDNEELAYKNTNSLLKKHSDIQGIYVNSFNSMGVIRSLTEHGMAGKVCLIASDITDEIKKYLDTGFIAATIFQNQYYQGYLGLRYLYQYIAENLQVEDTIYVKPEVVFRSNMSFYE